MGLICPRSFLIGWLTATSSVLGCGSAVEAPASPEGRSEETPFARATISWIRDTTVPEGGHIVLQDLRAAMQDSSPGSLFFQIANYLGAGVILPGGIEDDYTNSLSISTLSNDSGKGANNLYFGGRDNSINAVICADSKNATKYKDLWLGVGNTFLTNQGWLAQGVSASKTGTSGYKYFYMGDSPGIGNKACTPFVLVNPNGTNSLTFPVEIRGISGSGNVAISKVRTGLTVDHPKGSKSIGIHGDSDFPLPTPVAGINRIVIEGSTGLDKIASVTLRVETTDGIEESEVLTITSQSTTYVETAAPVALAGRIKSNPASGVARVDLALTGGRTMTYFLKFMTAVIWGTDSLAGDVGHLVTVILTKPTALSSTGPYACATSTFAEDLAHHVTVASLPAQIPVSAVNDDQYCATYVGEYYRAVAIWDLDDDHQFTRGTDRYVTGSLGAPNTGCGIGMVGFGVNGIDVANRAAYPFACTHQVNIGDLPINDFGN